MESPSGLSLSEKKNVDLKRCVFCQNTKGNLKFPLATMAVFLSNYVFSQCFLECFLSSGAIFLR